MNSVVVTPVINMDHIGSAGEALENGSPDSNPSPSSPQSAPTSPVSDAPVSFTKTHVMKPTHHNQSRHHYKSGVYPPLPRNSIYSRPPHMDRHWAPPPPTSSGGLLGPPPPAPQPQSPVVDNGAGISSLLSGLATAQLLGGTPGVNLGLNAGNGGAATGNIAGQLALLWSQIAALNVNHYCNVP